MESKARTTDENDSLHDIYSIGRYSPWVFVLLWFLASYGIWLAAGSLQGVLAVLFGCAGVLMLAFPPCARLPKSIWLFATLFIALSALSFLPSEGFELPAWRHAVAESGIPMGECVALQPDMALEAWVGQSLAVLVGLYMLGHRVNRPWRIRLALLFSLGIAAYVVISIVKEKAGWRYNHGIFGLMPNRNHTACLMAMGTICALGSMVQSIRDRRWLHAGLAVFALLIIFSGLFGFNISRAGFVLLALGLVAWFSMVGPSYLGKRAGLAFAILIFTGIGAFFVSDSRVKERITETAGRVTETVTAQPGLEKKNLLDAMPTESPAESWDQLDFRIPVYRDTLAMIRSEPWPGVGVGQFVYGFTQYRNYSAAVNGVAVLHPESDWLWLTVECGWPTTLAMVGLVGTTLVLGLRSVRTAKGRALRAGLMTAASLVIVHGLIDVPAHRIGVAWSACLLFAFALPMPTRPTSAVRNTLWRLAGLPVLLAGLYLGNAEWSNGRDMASVEAASIMKDVRDLYQRDLDAYRAAVAEKRDYQPEGDADFLAQGILKIDKAIERTPLDQHLHFFQGFLAAHYDDKQSIADTAFRRQRLLDPVWIGMSLKQAMAWASSDPARSVECLQDTLRRSNALVERQPSSAAMYGPDKTWKNILDATWPEPALAGPALVLAKQDPARLLAWATKVQPPALDTHMPNLLSEITDTTNQQAILNIWKARGSKAAVEKFLAAQSAPSKAENPTPPSSSAPPPNP